MSGHVGFGDPFTLDQKEAYRRQDEADWRARIEARKAARRQQRTRPDSQSTQSPITVTRDKDITYSKLDGLFRSVGFEARGPEEWNRILEESAEVVGLWDGSTLVGFARMTESPDQTTCSFHDAVVLPSHQGQGLLTQMQAIAERIIIEKNYTHASIEAVPGSEAIYEHLGWKPQALGELMLRGASSA